MNAYNEPLRKSNATLLHASKTSAEADAIVRGVVEDWVQATHHQRYLLEYVLSALDERPLTFLREWLLGHFPSNAGAYLTRMWQPLLAQLSANLCALANNADTDAESLDDLRRRLQRVQTASPVLEVLSTTIFPESGPSSHAPACRNSPEDTFLEVEEDDDDEALSLGVNITLKRKSQRENKQKRGKRPRQKTIDKGPNLKASELNAFRAYGAPVPQTRREADVLRHEVLDELRQSLTWYLEVVRWPQTHEAVLNAINEELSNPHQPNSSTNEDTRMASPELSRKNLESESETPAAYPMVQPMKAALYFDSVEGFGEWRILVSTRADKKLRETRKKDRETFRIIVKKIKELSTGHFSDDNQKRLNGPDTDIPIFEAKMTRDLRLVYQVDCVPEFGTDGERQVIKIFGIYTHAQLDQRFWNSVGTQLAKKGGKEYKYRCTYRMKPLTKGDNVYLPASFPAPETVVAGPVVELPNVRTEDLDELHALLVLEKFVTFSQAFLNSLLANQDVVHPFAVSSQEQEIIEHPHSCYVIGRSGTGKTTTMLFKMLGLERTWHLHKESMPRPRQVFVTQSRVLATKVEEYFGKMLDSLAAGAQSAKELSKLSTIRTGRDEGLVDLDDEENWRSDLPKRFSELRDEHFPLFITYDKLCKLLEADVETTIQDIGPMNDRLVDEEQTNSNEYMLQKRDSFVSYHVFLESYWSHFPQSLTKGLDPALVFSEFMGIIKGSEQAVLSERSSLDLTAYESLSHRTQSTFARQRGVIYSLFEAYTKQRIQLRQYDAADRTHRLIASLQNQKAGHKKIDYLYVDEVQDNLLIDALLLRMLCVNSNGLFFAGDTAQTISVGSAFRFNDLKAFMHRVEERSRAASNTSIAPAPPVQPRSFQLLVNYRSHGGIVKCASSLIRLIIDFWPYAIDMLDEERGVIDGLKPVFFHGWDKDTVRYEQFLFGDAGAPIEFGAQQCILVRDDAARDRLRADVGDIGLIMTLYESKGLEFNDVLLYNFFEDSTVDVSQWRVTLNAVDPDARQNAAAPRFDEIKHAGICSELKFLYVAVTRARKNLWVVDCSERGEPMRLLWTSRGLVQSCTPGTDVPKLAVSSTVEEWATAAEALFRSKRFMQAMHAYERAEMQREAAVSHAYHLRDKARSTTTGVLKAARARKEAFAKAARAFLTSAEGATKEKIAYYKIAGQCFVEAEDDVSAAKAFLHAREYTSAAQHFRKAGLFDDAISVIRDHKNDVAEEVAERIVNVARIHYFENEQLEKAAPLFASFEEELEFLEDFDFDIARAKLLESKGRILEAAELHLAEARPLDAIRLFLTDSANPKSLRRAASCLVQGMWTSSPLGTVVGQHGGSLAQFLALSGRLDKAAIAEQHADEISMFHALASEDTIRLQQLAQKFYIQTGNRPAALFSLDCICGSNPAGIQKATPSHVSAVLQFYRAYAQLLRELGAGHHVEINQPAVQQLFGYRTMEDDVFFIPSSTYLGAWIMKNSQPVLYTDDAGHRVSSRPLASAVQRILTDRLKIRIASLDEACRTRCTAFSVCINHVTVGCKAVECARQHPVKMDRSWYNTQIGLHLQHISILQLMFCRLGDRERAMYQRDWLERLYDSLFPPLPEMGSPANLSLSSIPQAKTTLPIVKEWIRESFYQVHRAPPDRILTQFMRLCSLAYEFDRAEAPTYIFRAPLLENDVPGLFLRDMKTTKASIFYDLTVRQSSSASWICLVLCLKHIVETPLSIDISILCAFIDQICTYSVVLARIGSTPPLHDVTMPYSWLVRVSKHLIELAAKQFSMSLTFILVDCMRNLLQQLSTTTMNLLFKRRPLGDYGLAVRGAFMSRVCKSMCLLGYNVRHDALRAKIVMALSSCRGNRVIPLCDEYFSARDWSGLARVIRQIPLTPLDGLVQLYHASRSVAGDPPPRNVRRVIYSAIVEIPQLLTLTTDSGTGTTLRGEAAPFVSNSESVRAMLQKIQADEQKAQGISDDKHDADDEQDLSPDEPEVDAEAIATQLSDDAPADALVEGPSDKELEYVRIVQAIYRRKLRHRQHAPDANDQARSTFYSRCLEQSRKMDWQYTHYRHLFLGPLPHVLVYLKKVQSWAENAKRRIKAKTGKSHKEYDDLFDRQTLMNNYRKTAQRLQDALRPEAAFHLQRDSEQLKALVKEVEALAKSLPANSTSLVEVEDDLAIAVKGIVTPPKPPPAKPEKPDVQIDDAYDLYNEAHGRYDED